MNLIQLTYINVKRVLKDPVKLAIMLITPLFVILFTYFINKGRTASHLSNIDVAFNIEDKGELGKEIIESQTRSQWIFRNNKEEALELLEKNIVAVVYNIPEDFTEKINNYEKPIIESYKRQEGNATIPLEMEINNTINRLIKEKLLKDKGVISNPDDLYVLNSKTLFKRNKNISTGDLHSTTMLLIYFIILSSSSIGTELIELKKKNVISRAVSTPNKSATIMGSFVLSFLIFQVAINLILLLIGKIFIGYEIINLLLITINIILASLFSITLSLAMTRIFNNEGTASVVAALITIATLFLSTFAQDGIYQNIPQFIKNLGKFTPQYWIFDSLEKSVYFPNIFIVILIILALFTTGTFKLKEFVRK